ncbi:serine protease [Streptomyces violens]|uniref:serine protease n=1 Tax=Streptomyces violens TaxID=66377 RepID=UPI0004BF6C31|nr:serine protease [Streptomyces violens]
MTRVGYWVDLFQAQRHLGAGFLLTRRFALTALHCLRNLDALDDRVDIALADERRVQGRVCRRAKDADLALIEIAASHELALQVPAAHVALRGDRWWGPYRPAPGDAQLSGGVDHGALRHTCEGGGAIEALQLTADQHLGDYSGYSGGPVEGTSAERDPVVLGILLEQAMDRQSTEHRAANVLFAATIAEAMRRFDHFDVGHLIDALRPPEEIEGMPRPPAPAPELRNEDTPPPQHTEAESLLVTLRRWSERGLIDPTQAAQLRLQVAQRIIDGELGAGGRDERD